MKQTYSFYHMMLVFITLLVFMYCGGDASQHKTYNDTTELTHNDTMSNHLRDPASAFPLPPVTGTLQDSSHIKDSVKKKE